MIPEAGGTVSGMYLRTVRRGARTLGHLRKKALTGRLVLDPYGVRMRALLLGERRVPWSSVGRVAWVEGTISTVVVELADSDETWALDVSRDKARAIMAYVTARGVRAEPY